MAFEVMRYHDISCGHRVHGHESKCAHLHGHNYRITFVCAGDGLDSVGRVIDFSRIKALLCMWVEEEWDHRFLVHENDPFAKVLKGIDEHGTVIVPFNPTAENMAEHLVEVVGPEMLAGTGIRLVRCIVEETRKCSVQYEVAG